MSLMNKNIRIDKISNTLKIDRQPNGYLKIKANLTRTGIFVYKTADGKTLREFRSAEEVFKANSLDSLNQVPLSLYHPPVFIDSKNYNTYSVGSVSNIHQDSKFIKGEVLVAGENAIEAIEDGIREISCGYTCDVVHKPGIYNGQHYDAIQQNIIYNHVAIVPRGRAGREVSLHLDSENSSNYLIGESMNLEKQLSEAVAKCDAANADAHSLKEELKTLKKELAASTEAQENMKLKLDSLVELEENFNKRVTARVSLETTVQGILKADTDLRSHSEIDLKKMVISAVYGDAISLENRDDAAINVLFEASVSKRNDTEEEKELKVDSSEVTPLENQKPQTKKVDIAAGIAAQMAALKNKGAN